MLLKPADKFRFSDTRARVADAYARPATRPPPPMQSPRVVEEWVTSCAEAYAALYRIYHTCSSAEIKSEFGHRMGMFYDMAVNKDLIGSFWFKKELGYSAELALLCHLFPHRRVHACDGEGAEWVLERKENNMHILRCGR